MDVQHSPLRIEPGSPSWPTDLDGVDSLPDCMWIRGRIEALETTPRIAIVGTRSPSLYGVGQAERFARALARTGVCVVSGLARGIDQAAHAAALAAGGATVAVLGCGVDRPWPVGRTTDAVAEKGALLSEFPPGQGPRPHHFPQRNRLIAGLSRAVLVVEAAWVSGSLITARWAVDQGREVYALPGRVDHPMSRGTHRLLREGARLVEAPEELLADLGLGAAPEPPPSPPQTPVLDVLRGETLTAAEAAERLERPLGEVLSELVALGLEGHVVRGPGGLYRRA